MRAGHDLPGNLRILNLGDKNHCGNIHESLIDVECTSLTRLQEYLAVFCSALPVGSYLTTVTANDADSIGALEYSLDPKEERFVIDR